MKINIIHLDDSQLTISELKDSFFIYKNLNFDIKLHSFTKVDDFNHFVNTQKCIDIFLLDIDLKHKHTNGLQIAKICRTQFPNSVILMLSVFDDDFNINRAKEVGADDFLTKNFNDKELPELIIATYEGVMFSRGELKYSSLFPKLCRNFPSFAGHTLHSISITVAKALRSAASTIYIEGESGTGKELVSNMIASYIPSNLPFIAVNCASFQEALLESELFGYSKGAFTGANQDKIGILESINEGWIFLDEINRLSLSAQHKLLRAIETKEIRRVGENKNRKINFKVISASNQSADCLIKSNKMELDFFNRISDIKIFLPPIRNRSKKEIADIIQHIAKTLEGGPYVVYPTTLRRLENATWGNGNVREIRCALVEMTASHANKVLLISSIPNWVFSKKDTNLISKEESSTIQSNTLSFTFNPDLPPSFDDFIHVVFSEMVEQIKLNFKNKGLVTSDRVLSQLVKLSRQTLQKYCNQTPEITSIKVIKKLLVNTGAHKTIEHHNEYHEVTTALHNFSLFIKQFRNKKIFDNVDIDEILQNLDHSFNVLSSFFHAYFTEEK